MKNIIDVRTDILKYADTLEEYSHKDLYCRMHLWAQVIRKSGIPLLRNSETSEPAHSTEQPQAGSDEPKPCASCVHNGEAGTHCNRCSWSYRNLFVPRTASAVR